MMTRLVVTITPGQVGDYAINVAETDLWNDDVVSVRGCFRGHDAAALHEVLLAVDEWQRATEVARRSEVG